MVLKGRAGSASVEGRSRANESRWTPNRDGWGISHLLRVEVDRYCLMEHIMHQYIYNEMTKSWRCIECGKKMP
jgi:hypothetical protein